MVFRISFSNARTGLRSNAIGNTSVTDGDDSQDDVVEETVTANVSVPSATFAG